MGERRRCPYGRTMTTLHIEHAITDLATWTKAFGALADVRVSAGVRNEQVRTPVDDPRFVIIDLEFDSADRASSFLDFLRTNVWSTPTASPALVGSPDARILEPVSFD